MRPLPGQSARHEGLAEYLDTHRHSYTRSEILSAWSQRRLLNAVRSGTVARILPGVYCGANHLRDPIVKGEAITLWHPPGVITGPLALHLYAPQLPSPSTVALLVSKGCHLRAPHWVRQVQAGPVSAYSTPQGIACATPGRALLDAWRLAKPGVRRELLYEALWTRACTWRELERETKRAARVSGRRDLERVLSWFAGGATSPLEVRAQHEALCGPGLQDLEWQAELRLRSRRVRADALHRGARVVIELDGERYHSSRSARTADRRRDVDLAAEGYVTVRFGWEDITRRPEWCRERLLAVIAGRLEYPSSA